jgi:hypothetical protein
LDPHRTRFHVSEFTNFAGGHVSLFLCHRSARNR